jgi:hypothetical protein
LYKIEGYKRLQIGFNKKKNLEFDFKNMLFKTVQAGQHCRPQLLHKINF